MPHAMFPCHTASDFIKSSLDAQDTGTPSICKDFQSSLKCSEPLAQVSENLKTVPTSAAEHVILTFF